MSQPQDWHALGFNPARGNPDSVGALSHQMTTTGNWLAETYEVLKGVQQQKDSWTGEASKAFVEKLGELPKLLDNAHQSLVDAGKALAWWQDTLTAHQRKAVDLENRAREAIAAAERADAAAQQANAETADQARRHAEEAWAQVEDIRRKALDLQDRWQDDARSVANRLEDATDIAPGFWDALGDWFAGAGEWVVDNLGEIGDFAGIIAAVAGTLMLIPGVNVIVGAVALVAGGIALAAHAGEMAVEGKWDEPGAWIGLGTDMLGMLPVVGPAARGVSSATDAFYLVDGLAGVARSGADTFVKGMSNALVDMRAPAEVFQTFGSKVANTVGGNADTIAKTVQGTFNIGTQAPVAADLYYHNETSGAVKDVTGYASFGGAGAQSYGEWQKTGSAFGELGGSIAEFTRAMR